MIRALFAAMLLIGIGTSIVSCGGPGNGPKPSGGLGY